MHRLIFATVGLLALAASGPEVGGLGIEHDHPAELSFECHEIEEQRYGSFERRFQIPEGVDTSKIEASFRKGVLTVMLPKAAEAQAAEKKIAVKAG